MTGAESIAAERKRQIEVERFSAQRDDPYNHAQLAGAAACYALICIKPADPDMAEAAERAAVTFWPWGDVGLKRRSERENLVKAGALIAAEIDRLDRAAAAPHP